MNRYESKKIRLLNIICKWDHFYTVIKFCVISLWIKQVVAYEKTCMEEQRMILWDQFSL